MKCPKCNKHMVEIARDGAGNEDYFWCRKCRQGYYADGSRLK